jgi:hypothetical protein
VPVIFVMGGRTDAYTPTDLVQKYYPWGYGAEDLPPWSIDFGFQTTGNQVDIWSPYFLRPDTDHFSGSGVNYNPDIDDRRETGGGQDGVLPRLPDALYGLMALKIETGVEGYAPDFPNGPFKAIFTFGGIKASGEVSDEMRIWNPALPATQLDGEPEDGVFSLFSTMPTRRAYGKAVFVADNPFKIALVGGVDSNGVPLNTVDIFSFDDVWNPSTGGWETFEGTLPEALEACAAGYNPGGGEQWVLAFAGWSGEEFSHKLYTARLESSGNQVIREPIVVTPRFQVGSTQSGSTPLTIKRAASMLGPVIFNRYYVVGGVDENGVESIVETLSLP